MYMKNVATIVLVWDLTRPATYTTVTTIVQRHLPQSLIKTTRCVLVGTMRDKKPCCLPSRPQRETMLAALGQPVDEIHTSLLHDDAASIKTILREPLPPGPKTQTRSLLVRIKSLCI